MTNRDCPALVMFPTVEFSTETGEAVEGYPFFLPRVKSMLENLRRIRCQISLSGFRTELTEPEFYPVHPLKKEKCRYIKEDIIGGRQLRR
jgi:hypothetical protein